VKFTFFKSLARFSEAFAGVGDLGHFLLAINEFRQIQRTEI
jgi:hypothetical protein